MDAAPAGSTPTTRTPGWRSASQTRQPASSPPPPTGTTSMSGASPSCRAARRSRGRPCPGRRWSAGRRTPGRASPLARTPRVRRRGRLVVGVARRRRARRTRRRGRASARASAAGWCVGTKIRPRMPSRAHANATPCPWLPAEAQTTPAARSVVASAARSGCRRRAACRSGPAAGPRASARPRRRWRPTAVRCAAAGSSGRPRRGASAAASTSAAVTLRARSLRARLGGSRSPVAPRAALGRVGRGLCGCWLALSVGWSLCQLARSRQWR